MILSRLISLLGIKSLLWMEHLNQSAKLLQATLSQPFTCLSLPLSPQRQRDKNLILEVIWYFQTSTSSRLGFPLQPSDFSHWCFRWKRRTKHKLHTMHWFAAVVTGELKCPISSIERWKHVELNKYTCALFMLRLWGFTTKETHYGSYNALKKDGTVDFYAVLWIITRGLLKPEQTHKNKRHANRIIFYIRF